MAVALAAVGTAAWAQAACVVIAPHPDGAPLARVAIDDGEPTLRITYVHSVTRTTVEERYRVDGARIVETEIRFAEHGPGLPTAADAGGAFLRRDGLFVVRGERAFEQIVMRVHRDQSPRLVAGTQTIDLARWGDRALVMTARAAACDAP